MEIIYTKDPQQLEKWDAYILKEDKGSHLMLSGWLQSFRSYGFDYEVAICFENDRIVGGFGAVIAKALWFKFFTVPYGPIVSEGYENHLDELISKVPERAKHYNCCYCHITLPFSETSNAHVYNKLPELPVLKDVKEGHRFTYVYSSNGLNWVDFKSAPDEETLLESFRASVRRYIRSSQRKDLEVRFLGNESDIKAGYELCLENARNNNYALRDWLSFKPTLTGMIADKKAKFMAAYKDGTLKGAALLVGAGNYNTYILGGTTKEKPDLLVGHFLHWEAIKLSFNENLRGYNISLGGSAGVVNLKNSYADAQIMFTNSKYHWILKPGYFRLYRFFEKKLKPHKKVLSKILALLKR
ncbi:MAG TPA: GNAT family N-acetyltransferase [Flavobacterium sp.]|nr:GNAT family N-acetyltransferase [Flavobacterium sp.]